MSYDPDSLVRVGQAAYRPSPDEVTFSTVSHNSGNLTRYVHGQEQAPQPGSVGMAPVERESTRVHTGGLSFNTGDGVLRSNDHASFQMRPTTAAETGSIAATLSSTFGPRATVDIPGVGRTDVRTAERLGVIRRDGDKWVDVGTPAAAAESLQDQQQEQQPADPGAAIFDAEDDGLWAEDIEAIPQPIYDRAVSSVVGVVALGIGSLADSAKAFSKATGMEPALATEYIEQGTAMYQRAADKALAGIGLHGPALDAFYASVREQPGKLKDVVQRLVQQRDPAGLVELGIAYKARHTDLSAYTKAGFQASVDLVTGEVLIQRGTGPWMKASDLK